MPERFNRPPTSVRVPEPVVLPVEQRTFSGEEQAAQWLKDHPELTPRVEGRRDCMPEIAELGAMMVAYEGTYPLVEMSVRVSFALEEAEEKRVWGAARDALAPIIAKLNTLQNETDISTERWEALRAQYKRLSRAVGIIRNGVIDHAR